MITTNNESFYNKLLMLRTHGITKDPLLMNENQGGWYYEMMLLGYNYRLTDFQAALGLSQLKRATEGLARRRAIASLYNDAFKEQKPLISHSGLVDEHAYHLYVIQVADRKGLYQHLKTNNVFAQVHYIPVHLMPYYKQFGWKRGDFPHSEKYYENCLSIPMYPSLKDEEIAYVINK